MENIEESCPLRITPTVRALSSALRGKGDVVSANGGRLFPEPEKLWFKESSAKNLRTRDFLSPTTMLNTLYADGQVCGWRGRPSVRGCLAFILRLCLFKKRTRVFSEHVVLAARHSTGRYLSSQA